MVIKSVTLIIEFLFKNLFTEECRGFWQNNKIPVNRMLMYVHTKRTLKYGICKYIEYIHSEPKQDHICFLPYTYTGNYKAYSYIFFIHIYFLLLIKKLPMFYTM